MFKRQHFLRFEGCLIRKKAAKTAGKNVNYFGIFLNTNIIFRNRKSKHVIYNLDNNDGKSLPKIFLSNCIIYLTWDIFSHQQYLSFYTLEFVDKVVHRIDRVKLQPSLRFFLFAANFSSNWASK